MGSGICLRLGRGSITTPSAWAADWNSASLPGLEVAAKRIMNLSYNVFRFRHQRRKELAEHYALVDWKVCSTWLVLWVWFAHA